MSTTDRYLSLAKSIVPSVVVSVFAIVKVAAQGATFVPFLIPFVVVAVIGVVQAVRRSGLIDGSGSRQQLRGSIGDSAPRGRALADELLDER